MHPRWKRSWLLLTGAAWLCFVTVGIIVLFRYQTAGGEGAQAPERWPAESAVKLEGQATLLMFLHPRCPCSRASVGELAAVMTRAQGRARAVVLFTKPRGFAEGWERTDLWANAARIPGVTVRLDEGGIEAKRFDARTSGQVLLYDADGALAYNGGITKGRGHAGANGGEEKLAALLTTGKGGKQRAPVYGCGLTEKTKARDPEALCCKK